MALAYIGLGANLGDALATLKQAAHELAAAPGINALQLSAFYRTAPVDSHGPDYINAVAAVQTSLAPLKLLALLQETEQRHGRARPYRNAPRTLDLDLLLYDDLILADDRLILPHPRMHQRAFVLLPLKDLAPALQLAQGSLDTLLRQCADQEVVRLAEGGN